MNSEVLLDRLPVQIRRGIPVFTEKGEEAIRSDRYERYWEVYGDPKKLTAFFQAYGLRLIRFEPEILCQEALDGRGNVILWRAVGWFFEKERLPAVEI